MDVDDIQEIAQCSGGPPIRRVICSQSAVDGGVVGRVVGLAEDEVYVLLVIVNAYAARSNAKHKSIDCKARTGCIIRRVCTTTIGRADQLE